MKRMNFIKITFFYNMGRLKIPKAEKKTRLVSIDSSFKMKTNYNRKLSGFVNLF